MDRIDKMITIPLFIIMILGFGYLSFFSENCIQYEREVELICENVENKINMATITDSKPQCENFLKVKITNYNETFSNSVDCVVGTCNIKEVKC